MSAHGTALRGRAKPGSTIRRCSSRQRLWVRCGGAPSSGFRGPVSLSPAFRARTVQQVDTGTHPDIISKRISPFGCCDIDAARADSNRSVETLPSGQAEARLQPGGGSPAPCHARLPTARCCILVPALPHRGSCRPATRVAIDRRSENSCTPFGVFRARPEIRPGASAGRVGFLVPAGNLRLHLRN